MGRWRAPASAPQCPACRGRVFPAEAFMASDRTPFHKSCVKCLLCKKTLTSNTLNEHQQELYCKPCYENLLNPKEFHSGNYGGLVTPEDLQRRSAEEKRNKEKAERKKRERRCPKCDRRAYPEDSVQIADVFFHKVCLKCQECGKGPDMQTPMMLGPKEEKQEENLWNKEEELVPYCKFCFAKKFKISILNIQETVQTMPEASGISL